MLTYRFALEYDKTRRNLPEFKSELYGWCWPTGLHLNMTKHAETFLNLKVNCMVGADLQVCTWIWQKHCWGTVRLQAAKAFSCCTSSSAVEVPSVVWKSGVSSEGASDLEVLQFGRFRLTLCVLTLWILFYITFQASSPLKGCMITEYVSPWYNHNGLTGCKTPTYLLSFSPWRPVYVSLFHLFISVFMCVSACMYECMYLCVCVCMCVCIE